MPSLLRRAARAACPTIAVLLSAFLAIEAYLRLFAGNADQSILSTFYYDDDSVPRLLPNARGTFPGYGGRGPNVIRTNSLGFRGPEPLADPLYRVVFIGDSIVFNGALPEAETFTHLLQDKLRAAHGNSSIEVLNLALYDTYIKDYYAKLQGQALALRPDLIVVGLYLNDAAPSGFRPQTRPWRRMGGMRSYAYEHLALLLHRGAIIFQARWGRRLDWVEPLLSKAYLRSDAEWRALLSKAQAEWGAAWRAEAWAEIGRYLEKMKTLCAENDVRLALIIFPVAPQIELPADRYRLFAPQEQARQLAARLELPLLDPLPLLRIRAAPLPMYDQCHFTKEGNTLIAEALYPFVEAQLARNHHCSRRGHPPIIVRWSNHRLTSA